MLVLRLKTFGNAYAGRVSRTTNGYNYADSDDLKRMKDSEILAEEEKQTPGYGKTVGKAAKYGLGIGAAAAGAGALAAGAGALKDGYSLTSGQTWKSIGRKAGKWGGIALAAGTAIGAAKGLVERNREKQQVDKYNARLNYAQRRAARRERTDFKANMSNRDGYSY